MASSQEADDEHFAHYDHLSDERIDKLVAAATKSFAAELDKRFGPHVPLHPIDAKHLAVDAAPTAQIHRAATMPDATSFFVEEPVYDHYDEEHEDVVFELRDDIHLAVVVPDAEIHPVATTDFIFDKSAPPRIHIDDSKPTTYIDEGPIFDRYDDDSSELTPTNLSFFRDQDSEPEDGLYDVSDGVAALASVASDEGVPAPAHIVADHMEEHHDAVDSVRRTVRRTPVDLLQPKETLLLGHAYCLISIQEVTKAQQQLLESKQSRVKGAAMDNNYTRACRIDEADALFQQMPVAMFSGMRVREISSWHILQAALVSSGCLVQCQRQPYPPPLWLLDIPHANVLYWIWKPPWNFLISVTTVGASLVHQAANTANDSDGDGTIAITLTKAMFAEGCKSVEARMIAMDFRYGVSLVVDAVVTMGNPDGAVVRMLAAVVQPRCDGAIWLRKAGLISGIDHINIQSCSTSVVVIFFCPKRVCRISGVTLEWLPISTIVVQFKRAKEVAFRWQ